jgi:hypothetical protein
MPLDVGFSFPVFTLLPGVTHCVSIEFFGAKAWRETTFTLTLIILSGSYFDLPAGRQRAVSNASGAAHLTFAVCLRRTSPLLIMVMIASMLC